MVSTYHGIETGRRGVEYFRKGMEISGVNVSNAKTPGYSRQVVNATASEPLQVREINSFLGTGVKITDIERMRDQFLDVQYRRAIVDQSYWSVMDTAMTRIQAFMVDTNKQTLSGALDIFWESLQTVQKNPEPGSESLRYTLLEDATNLINYMSRMKASYVNYRSELNEDIRTAVYDANTMIDQIALLNKSIQRVRLAGGEPNAMLDERDLLADELCKLVGATIGTSTDELDGDYKIYINGKVMVQGAQTRHLVLVENPGNSNYYEVQIENNQYDLTSDRGVADVLIERRADDLRTQQETCTMDGTHELDVLRMADEMYWKVGFGSSRMTGIKDSSQSLNIAGSFALQVGSNGVRRVSDMVRPDSAGNYNMLGAPGPGDDTEYMIRMAAGENEVTIDIKWDSASSVWTMTDNNAPPYSLPTAGDTLTTQDLANFINGGPGAALNITATLSQSNDTVTLESTDGHLMSLTDMNGDFFRKNGLVNANPTVLIEVTADDSLETIANKINSAYRYDHNAGGMLAYTTIPPDTAPATPEQWLHASVMTDANGDSYLSLTSNVAGEANRINVMPGSACGVGAGETYVAELLGFLENNPGSGQTGVTTYIQYNDETGGVITRYTPEGDVFVDDAYFKYDDTYYLSSGNAFKDARKVATNGNAPADVMNDVSAGIRFTLNGLGETTITVRHPLTSGELFAMIKARDDVILGELDKFDDLTYKLASELNAFHYSGYGGKSKYGTSDYTNTTGMKFFEDIKFAYSAFGSLAMDKDMKADPLRFAAASGDGTGHYRGDKDGSNALSMAQLKQAKLFLGGTADFNGLYKNIVATVGAFGEHAYAMLKGSNDLVKQVDTQRASMMGVSSNEEMLKLVDLNKSFQAESQYLSKLFEVIDTIINGVGRVGK